MEKNDYSLKITKQAYNDLDNAFYLINEDKKDVVIMRFLSGKQRYQDFI